MDYQTASFVLSIISIVVSCLSVLVIVIFNLYNIYKNNVIRVTDNIIDRVLNAQREISSVLSTPGKEIIEHYLNRLEQAAINYYEKAADKRLFDLSLKNTLLEAKMFINKDEKHNEYKYDHSDFTNKFPNLNKYILEHEANSIESNYKNK